MSTILWMDLEMTGLEPAKDRITEVAALVTDWDFKEIAHVQAGVKQDEALLRELYGANEWSQARPEQTAEDIKISLAGMPEAEAERMIIDLVREHCGTDEPVLLAGNSIHQDRRFIRQYWPELEKLLHYRMLDVSAWKVVMQGKYNVPFVKKEAHRALDDIRESIEELAFYLKKAQF